MSKTIITTGPSNQIIIHSSDGKDQAKPTSAGQPVTVTTNASGKTTATHGQIAGTTVIHDNPA